MATDGRALTPVGANIAAIFSVLLIAPLIMTFAMSGGYGEEEFKTAPNQANGFAWIDGGNCTVYPYTSTIISALPYGNFTYNGGPAGGAPNGVGCGFGPYEISVPAEVFNGSESNLTRFNFHVESAFYSTNVQPNGTGAPCQAEWRFNANLLIDGVRVIRERAATSPVCIDHGWSPIMVGGIIYNQFNVTNWMFEWNHSVDPIEASEFDENFRNCQPNCNVTIEINNLRAFGAQGGYALVPDIFSDTQRYQMQTYVGNGELSSSVLNWSTWVLTAFFGLVTIASTPLWNPFAKHIAKWGG